MISSSFPGNVVSSSSSRVKPGPGSTSVPRTFAPFGKYADVGSQKIKSPHPGLRLHVGSASTLYLSKGTLLGKEITYISQIWNAWDAESTQMFYEQVLPYIHPETLRPLMGICAPTVIGIYSAAAGRLSLAMELPHAVGWRPADPYISAELKEKIVIAYQAIHDQNILHNDVKLENMLIGDDDKVTIVDFCKMVVSPEPGDIALEMRAVKFVLDYDGAKEIEYKRLRRAESRMGKDFQRSWLRRAAESLGLASEGECGGLPSGGETYLPPFSFECLTKWDSEVVTEGTTHCPGWRGQRFEVPEDMRSPAWPGAKDHTPPSIPPRQHTDPSGSTKKAFSSKYSTERCHYFPSLWSPRPEPTTQGRKNSIGASSSSTTPTDLSDYASVSERSSATGTGSSEGVRAATLSFTRKRSRAEDLVPSDSCSRGSKRTRRSKSLEPFAKYEGGQSSWATYRVEGLGPPFPSPQPKGKERESPALIASPPERSPTVSDLSTFRDLSPSPRTSASGSERPPNGSSRRRVSTLAPRWSSLSTRQTLATTSPRHHCPRPKSEKRYSVVVMDSEDEDKVWFMSREALRDVKGYLEVKRAMGAAMEMRSGGEEGIRHFRLQAEKVMRSPSTCPTRKRAGIPEDNGETARKPKRRRSWPDIDSCVSKPPIMRQLDYAS